MPTALTERRGASASSAPSPSASDRRFSTKLSGLGGATLAIETALLASGFHASALAHFLRPRRQRTDLDSLLIGMRRGERLSAPSPSARDHCYSTELSDFGTTTLAIQTAEACLGLPR